MAISLSNLPSLTTLRFQNRKPLPVHNPKPLILTSKTKPQSPFPITFRNGKQKRHRFKIRNSVLPEPENWVRFGQSVLPGGSWWSLSEDDHVDITAAKPITVMVALRRMWELIAGDRWLVFVAFGSLVIAALSEISIPSVLAASIFSAQSGETMVFSRSSELLVMLCFTSGICRLVHLYSKFC
jgi:hypothetical protein